MKNLFILLLFTISMVGNTQTVFTESVALSGQTQLVTDFPFADDITIKTWDKNEVKVIAHVTINDGADDNIFELKSSTSGGIVSIVMLKEKWENQNHRKNNCFSSTINYEVYLPKSMQLSSKTINGNYMLNYYTQAFDLVTISGDIDITFAGNPQVDLRMKTISGEVYSNLDINMPQSKENMRQLIGMNTTGKLGIGGQLLKMETISGNIYLRKG